MFHLLFDYLYPSAVPQPVQRLYRDPVPHFHTAENLDHVIESLSGSNRCFHDPVFFDEKYQLMGILTLRDIIKGLEPKFLQETGLIKMDPSLTVFIGDFCGPKMKEESQSTRAPW